MSESFRLQVAGGSSRVVCPGNAMHQRKLTGTLARAGVVLNTRCGERGLCRGCEVESSTGLIIKACQVSTDSVLGLTLTVPERSQLLNQMSIVADFRPRCEFEINPLFRPLEEPHFAICIDIGTTTVVMAAVRLADGKLLGKTSRLNAQTSLGDDVVTRIERCSTATGLRQGQELVLNDTLLPLWLELAEQTGMAADHLVGWVVSGNTTMLHLLVGEDPSGMGTVPFKPVFLEARRLRQSRLPLSDGWGPLRERAIDWALLPSYSAFVGADVAAGWLASGMVDAVGASLLVDLGTNGEMILQHDGRIWGCATAAGPAFEGVQLSWGSRAVNGAVSRIVGNSLCQNPGQLEVERIGTGRQAPNGFCGSAYMDFMAIGRRIGLLSPHGRFQRDRADELGVTLLNRDGMWIWPLDPATPAGPSINEADIALLLQAKAAIAAGLQVLMRCAGIRPHEVERLYLAGGFGLNLSLQSAIDCGLLKGFSSDQIEVIGNSSLGGAYICLLDQVRYEELGRATAGATIIELNTEPDFEDAYIDHLMLGDE